MKLRHLLLALSITAIWGLNFSVIKLGRNSLMKRYPVSTIAPLSLLVPVFGLLGSVIIFNENLSLNKIVAVVLIVTGLGVGLYGQRILSAIINRIAQPQR